MALQHIRRARKYSPADVDPGVFAPKITIEINTIGAGNDDPAHIVKVMLQFMGMSTTGRLSGSLSAYGLKSVLTNLAVNSGGLLPLDIELFDPRNASIGTSLVTSVSPLRLVMEDITHFCGAFPLNDGVTFCDWTSQFFSYLRQQLSEFQGQISRDALSHIALMLAAVCRCLKRMPGVSDAEEERLRDLILTRSYEVDKGSALMRNTMLAFCMIPVREDIDRLGLDVFRMLLHATGNLITSSFHPPHHLIKDTNFRQAVLRIAKAYPGDRKLQIHVADILERCADGDWVLPLHSDFQDVMTHLIECSFGPEKRPWHSQAPSGIFAMIARVADADQFLRSVKLLCSRGLHKKLARKQAKTYLNLASEFINRILGLNSNDDQSYSELLEAQIWLVVAILSNYNWEWNPYYDWTLAFFNRVLEADEDLHWPSYFISAGISPSSDNDSKSTRSQPLKVMNAQRLMPFWTFSVEEANEAIRNTWCGEAILLLWKKANLEVARGRLHSDWDKSIFFDIGVASTVVKYFESVMDQGYNGVDWEFLRKYLETVQMETGYTREKWQTGIRARNVDSANLYSQEIVLLWGDIVDALSTLNDLVSKGEAEK
ncbi:hypothetical protein FRC03_006001 [Tulasnella sp. 419]|nr:hypothetical protein FRC03_006001 [Tulasnella sp. 419]